jgi:hypothetical protein
MTTHKKHINNTSGHRGVMFRKDTQKHIARITVDGKCHHLGQWDTQAEAIAAFQVAEKLMR